ncbi:MAG: substrate-binding domain-containing protein [Kiritimatiellae bacterium]|nr:substrate-binding domain-containing protein [Kiritimatiellia bacterium]
MNVILYFQPSSKTSAPGKLSGVQEIAEKNGWHVQSIDGFPPAENIRKLVDFWKPIGAIAECGNEHTEIDTHIFGTIPVVFFSHNPKTLPASCFSVSHDSIATAQLAAKELLMTGFENFAYIPYAERRYWSEERQRGFCDALTLNGKHCTVFKYKSNVTDVTGRQEALRRFLARLPKPCAVFAANDKTAAETITAARFEGLAVPEEVAVLGVDNYAQICEHTVPPLSSIEPDFRRGGNLAVLLLLSLAHGKRDQERMHHMTFGPLRVVRRASTRLLSAPDRVVSEALDLIRREACQGLRSAKVASLFSCSRRQADIRFRNATGHSILEEIHAVQLECAKQMLQDSNVQLKTISDFCGFAHPNSLRKFFRSETGMSMSEWRLRVNR